MVYRLLIKVVNNVRINSYGILWLANYPRVQKTLDSTPIIFFNLTIYKKKTVSTVGTQYTTAGIQTPVNTTVAWRSK